MAARANFPLSASGCPLDTSPPKVVEEMHELAATGDSRRSPYAIALPLEGGMSGRTEGGVFALCANA